MALFHVTVCAVAIINPQSGTQNYHLPVLAAQNFHSVVDRRAQKCVTAHVTLSKKRPNSRARTMIGPRRNVKDGKCCANQSDRSKSTRILCYVNQPSSFTQWTSVLLIAPRKYRSNDPVSYHNSKISQLIPRFVQCIDVTVQSHRAVTIPVVTVSTATPRWASPTIVAVRPYQLRQRLILTALQCRWKI